MKVISVPSQTSEGKSYYLKTGDAENDRAFECSCPSFLFRNPLRKSCKHMREYNRKFNVKYV